MSKIESRGPPRAAHHPPALGADPAVLDRARRHHQHCGAAAGRGWQDAQCGAELTRRAVAEGDQADRPGVPRVRHRQLGHDRAGGRQAARPGRPQVLRRDAPQARSGQEARRTRAGLLGRQPDRRRIAERGRQGRLRPGVPRRQSRVGAGQRRRRRHPEHRRTHATAAGRQGLRDRRGAADLRSVRRRQQGDREGHRDHHRRRSR